MPATNPEYLACRIAQMDDFIKRLKVEIARYKRLQKRTIASYEDQSRQTRQED